MIEKQTTYREFDELTGHTMRSVVVASGPETCLGGGDSITFVRSDGRKFQFYHDQHRCENVRIEDVCGDTADLIGRPIMAARELATHTRGDDPISGHEDASLTYTFYVFTTLKGSVTVRWRGESNGYYSERVDFREVTT